MLVMFQGWRMMSSISRSDMLNETRLASPVSSRLSACSSGVVPAFCASSPMCWPSIDGSGA